MQPITDTWPRDFKWISLRKARAIVERSQATPSGRLHVKEVKATSPNFLSFAPKVEVTAAPNAIGDNPASLAVSAAHAVFHETGTLQQPDQFVRMTLKHANIATFEVPFAWPDGSQQRVSVLFASHWVQGVGRVFIALFGSPHNILGDMSPERYHTGRVPSDANGLYAIIDSMREPEDMQLKPEMTREDRHENDASDERRVELAASIVYGLYDPLPSQPLDILAEPMCITRHQRLNGHDFDLAMVGSAIWAGSPSPKEDASIHPLSRVQPPPSWEDFNDHLYECLEAWHDHGELLIPEICFSEGRGLWRDYASWFVELAHQFGVDEYELYVQRQLSRWDVRRFVKSRDGERDRQLPSGQKGQVVGIRDSDLESLLQLKNVPRLDEAVLVTSDGTVVPVLVVGGQALYWPDTEEPVLKARQRMHDVLPDELEKVRELMWLQAAEWVRRAH